MKIAMYAHGGSGNHGCEAIVRSTIKILGDHEYYVYSENPEEDIFYHLDEIAHIEPAKSDLPKGLGRLTYLVEMKALRNDKVYYNYVYRKLKNKIREIDVALSIGGDNYCYSGFLERFQVQNDIFHSLGIPIILWGCSIDPDRINNNLIKDLKKYDYIIPREFITYKKLKSIGFDNLVYAPDPAFLLDKREDSSDEFFFNKDVVGINISPLIEKQEIKPGILIDNCKLLIEYILKNTSMSIALIPHVVWNGNDDQFILQEILSSFKEEKRIKMISDSSSIELKEFIGKCRFMIAARTHASIAAYSMAIPSIVIGYSVKSIGIAQDLFGTDENFVLSIKSIEKEDSLLRRFQWLVENENLIKEKYKERLHPYLEGLYVLPQVINHYV